MKNYRCGLTLKKNEGREEEEEWMNEWSNWGVGREMQIILEPNIAHDLTG